MKIGSLFTGYGGLDMAVETVLGARTMWVADNAPGPQKILGHRFPGTPNLGDITQVDWSQVEPVDVITGGSPCQDVSHAGRRAGMTEGTRSNLWVVMREAIATIKPTFVVWENVRGAYSAEADSDMEFCPGCMGDAGDRGPVLRALGRVLGDLSELGFDAAWHGIRAADVGACHGRHRVFVLAWRRDASDSDDARLQGQRDPQGATSARREGHAEPGAGRPDLALLPTPRATDGSKGGPNQRGSKGDLMLPSAVHQLPPTPRATRGGSSTETTALLPTPSAADGSGGRYNSTGHQVTLPGTARELGEQFGQYADAIRRQESLFGRPAPGPTEPGKTRPRLSARFAEWMMGLHDGWITDVPGITRREALTALGNGVVPQQAIAALRWCLAARVQHGGAA